MVLMCGYSGKGLGMDGISGAAMMYMMATALVSLMENLEIFGLNTPLPKFNQKMFKKRFTSKTK